MRPIASTAVASMQNTAAPDSASELICVKCQSLASPSTEEYWHIGATTMRLESVRPRSLIGENRALMGEYPGGRKSGRVVCSCAYRPPQPTAAATLPYGCLIPLLFDTSGLDQLQIGRRLALDQIVHVGRLHRHRLDAELRQARLHRRIGQHLLAGRMQFFDD